MFYIVIYLVIKFNLLSHKEKDFVFIVVVVRSQANSLKSPPFFPCNIKLSTLSLISMLLKILKIIKTSSSQKKD